MGMGAHSHAAGEVEVVATVGAGTVDLRVAYPAHFGVHKIPPSPKEIGPLPGSVESSPRLPRRHACERLHITDEIPALVRRESVCVAGHGITNFGRHLRA